MRFKQIPPVITTTLLLLPALAPASGDHARERVRLDAGWHFHLGDIRDVGGAPEILKWRVKPAGEDPAEAEKRYTRPDAGIDGPDWKDAAPGEDVFAGQNGSAWFHTVLPEAPGPGRILKFSSVDDAATVYLNGKKVTYNEGWDKPFQVDLDPAWDPKAENHLAVLVHNFAGPGGIKKTVLEAPGFSREIPKWRWKRVEPPKPVRPDAASLTGPTTGAEWRDADVDEDVFEGRRGFMWFRAELPNVPGPGRLLCFDAVDDNADVFLNGRKLVHHEGWNESFNVDADRAWKKDGPNHLCILVENTFGGGYVKTVTLQHPGIRPAGAALPDYDVSAWREVDLPHDFVVEGTFDAKQDKSHGYLPMGVGWYRKTFEIPASDQGRVLWLDFDGIYRNAQIHLNGRQLGTHVSGYTSARYDITDAAVYGGKNVLVVRVDARVSEGWWYEGGGIYRHVWLNKASPLHVEPAGVFVTSEPRGGKARLKIETAVANRSRLDAKARVVGTVLDADGRKVLALGSDAKVKKGGRTVLKQEKEIPGARLWSPEDPHLYRLVTEVVLDGRTVDRVETPFGVRSVRFDKDRGFLLNGKRVMLQGTCNHQDHAGVGIAVPDRVFEFRLKRLMEMGMNAYRCSHNPPAPEVLDLCDRLGILVLDENRRLGDSPEVLYQVESMVKRDRNHPSVVMWMLCNEEAQQGKPAGKRMGTAMKKLIRKLDPSRLVSAAMNGGWGKGGLTEVLDVQGFNYNIGAWDGFRKNHPDMPVYGSETGSTVGSRGEYANDLAKGYVSTYDLNHPAWAETAENAWKAVVERPHFAGAFVWTGFDYRGEPTPYSWPCINSHFGILDMCGFPKDNFWYYKSWWGKDPVLHLLPHWNWKGREGQETDVWAQSNCDEVELFLNGKSQGKKRMEKWSHLEWKVKYAPGTLSAKGYRNGKVLLEETVETTGEPAALRLKSYSTDLIADRGDTTPVDVEVVDSKGRVVPTASNLVRFAVQGPAELNGVGNGDPSSHEPDRADQRSAFHGLCQVLVRAGGKPGRVTLTATSPGLKPASTVLQTTPPSQ